VVARKDEERNKIVQEVEERSHTKRRRERIDGRVLEYEKTRQERLASERLSER
jgi:hypothetical protein